MLPGNPPQKPLISDDQIRAFRARAELYSDAELVGLCDKALAGDLDARDRCAARYAIEPQRQP